MFEAVGPSTQPFQTRFWLRKKNKCFIIAAGIQKKTIQGRFLLLSANLTADAVPGTPLQILLDEVKAVNEGLLVQDRERLPFERGGLRAP